MMKKHIPSIDHALTQSIDHALFPLIMYSAANPIDYAPDTGSYIGLEDAFEDNLVPVAPPGGQRFHLQVSGNAT